MRLKVRFPQVEPNTYEMPATCPYGCGGQAYRRHGIKGERKPLRDVKYAEVLSVIRASDAGGASGCIREAQQGAQQSQRLRAMTVLYVLGLSYGAVEDFVNALGGGIGKTTVYNNVQAAGNARRQQQAHVKQGGKRAVIGADGTFVKVNGGVSR